MKRSVMLILLLTACLSAPAQPYLYDGLRAFWPFNGNANDESGYNNNGTAYGVWPMPDHNGVAGFAYYFDGIASKVTVPKDKFVADLLTVSFWIKISNLHPFNFAMACSDFSVFTQQDTVGVAISIPTTKMVKAPITMNAWTHVVGTFDNQDIRLYINGVLKDSIYHPGIIYDMNWDMSIGAFGSNYWEGQLDDIRIYNRVFGQDEITQLWEYYGIDHPASPAQMGVWPVPCSDYINFEWSDDAPLVSIYALDGRLVMKDQKPEPNAFGGYQINLQSLDPGIYQLSCSGTSKQGVGKIIVSR